MNEMNMDLENMIRQAAAILKRHGGSGYAFDLWQLAKNLRELRDRHAAGDATVVDEFFKLYVLNDKASRTEENAANAKLIGAAPELLASLIKMIDLAEAGGMLNPKGRLAVEVARAAISKAT